MTVVEIVTMVRERSAATYVELCRPHAAEFMAETKDLGTRRKVIPPTYELCLCCLDEPKLPEETKSDFGIFVEAE